MFTVMGRVFIRKTIPTENAAYTTLTLPTEKPLLFLTNANALDAYTLITQRYIPKNGKYTLGNGATFAQNTNGNTAANDNNIRCLLLLMRPEKRDVSRADNNTGSVQAAKETTPATSDAALSCHPSPSSLALISCPSSGSQKSANADSVMTISQ